MKNIISNLNKAFESRIRLGIMSILMVNDRIDFISLKELLQASDGNLASHLRSLEKSKLINVEKQFVARKPKTSYSATTLGRELFTQHLNALEKLIDNK